MSSRPGLVRRFRQRLLKAAAEARQQHFHEAELDLRACGRRPTDGTPRCTSRLGVMLRQQEQFDDAYDELGWRLRLMPDLPENHSALSYLFYRLDDGPNAIAEARTALSIDPKNAEAYQYLGARTLLAGAVSRRRFMPMRSRWRAITIMPTRITTWASRCMRPATCPGRSRPMSRRFACGRASGKLTRIWG